MRDRIFGHVIGTLDLDAPLYRVFPLWFFEQAIVQGSIALLSPDCWEDPYEDLASQVMMEYRRDCGRIKQQPLQGYLSPAFAQCWSMIRESDTLLRAYSRVARDPHFHRNTAVRHEGVQVQSTARRLLGDLALCALDRQGVEYFGGPVEYLDQEQVKQRIGEAVVSAGPVAAGKGESRARLLLLKRKAFSYESEVRLIVVSGQEYASQKLVKIPVDPNLSFQSVAFDPRLAPFELREREAKLRALGYEGDVRRSLLYQKTLIQMRLPDDWQYVSECEDRDE